MSADRECGAFSPTHCWRRCFDFVGDAVVLKNPGLFRNAVLEEYRLVKDLDEAAGLCFRCAAMQHTDPGIAILSFVISPLTQASHSRDAQETEHDL